jgi:hypothetical protein
MDGWMDGWMDRHEDASSRFSQLCEKRLNGSITSVRKGEKNSKTWIRCYTCKYKVVQI